MSKKLHLNNPKHAAEAMEFSCSLPENERVTILSNIISPRETTYILRKNRDGTKTNISCPKAVKV